MIYSEATARAARARRRDRHPGRARRRPAAARWSPTTRCALGAVGATGTAAANRLAREADLVIGVGTRWSDFTTASKSAFQDPGVRFVNVNVARVRRGQARGPARSRPTRAWRSTRCATRWPASASTATWTRARPARRERVGGEVARLVAPRRRRALPTQAAVIGAVNDAAGETGVVVCAAGSMPGDLHKLWRARDPDGKGYHVEYGYSCMGYEIPGGMGVKLAAPEREVYVLVGDGSYLMLPGELATAVAERIPIVDRARRQPRLRVDRRAVALGRLGAASGPTTAPRQRRAAARRADGARSPQPRCRSTSPPTPRASARASSARRPIDELRAALARRARRRRPGRRPRRGRPLRRRARATRAGGTCRSPRSPTTPRCARPARRYEQARRAQRAYLEAPMSDLLVPPAPTGRDGTILAVTPESAGWRYVGFEVVALAAGESCASARPASASCASSSIAGTAHVAPSTASGATSAGAPTRSRAARRRLPAAGHARRRSTRRRREVGAVLRAGAGRRRRGARRCPAPRSRPRRAATARHERTIHPILMGDQRGRALLVCEVHHARRALVELPAAQARPRRPAARDAARGDLLPPRRARATASASSASTPTTARSTRRSPSGDRDCVLVPRGYHTVSAPPGYDLYYLNVMAGPRRAWAVTNDPDHRRRRGVGPGGVAAGRGHW